MSITPSISSSIGSSITGSLGGGLPIGAIAHFNETSIVGSSPVTAWTNIGYGGSGFDLDVILGTGANLTKGSSNSLDIISSSGSAGLETTSGTTIATPMTIFLVSKASALPASVQQFTSSKSLASESSQFLINASSTWVFNAGVGLNVGTADTNVHLHTARHNGDSTTSYTVSDVGTTTGNAGSEPLDFGTIFANQVGGNTMIGDLHEYIIYDRALSDFEVTQAQSFLTNKWGL